MAINYYKFYTIDKTALLCYKAIKRYTNIKKTDLIIEPSAGNGSFIKYIKKLSNNLSDYYAPIDVMKQDVYKHKVQLYNTIKQYVKSIDKQMGGSTIQQNNMIVWKKVIREIVRPFWQILSLITMKSYRCIKNYLF